MPAPRGIGQRQNKPHAQLDMEDQSTFGQGGARRYLQLETKKYISFLDFETMDTEPQRQALSPKRLHWLENCIMLANNDSRAVPGQGSVLATITGETISVWYYAFVDGVDYIIAFTTVGKAWAVNQATGVKTNFASGFSDQADVTQWEDDRILIGDATKGYCTWDGTLFIAEGNLSPNITLTSGGEGYDSAPAVTIATVAGGSGSGATATATVTDGVVTDVTLTNAGSGYVATDVVTVSFTGGTPTGGGVIGVTILRGGFGYVTATPTCVFSAPGGGGVTATGTVVIALGQVTGINITNPGTLYLATPTITITPAGADAPSITAVAVPIMDTVASAEARVWPFTVKPSTLAIFAGRVWLGLGRDITYTGTEGYDDMNVANAAGTTTLQDADLVHEITALRAQNNYLFIIGDQSIKQIGTVSVSEGETNFNVTTLSSDQGTPFKNSVVSYNRLVTMTNHVGVYAIFGASVEKISNPMLQLFRFAGSGVIPVAAVFDLYGRHCLLTLIQYTDPVDGPRSVIMVYQDKRWQIWSQGDGLLAILVCPLLNGRKLYGTSGSDITELFSDENEPVDITIISALSHDNKPQMGKRAIREGTAQSTTSTNTLNVTVDSENGAELYSFQSGRVIQWVNNSSQNIQWQNNSLQDIDWIVSGFGYYSTAENNSGIYLGFTMEGNVTGFSFNNYVIEYQDGALFESQNTLG